MGQGSNQRWKALRQAAGKTSLQSLEKNRGKKEGMGESRARKYCYLQKNRLLDGSGLPKLLGDQSSLKIQDFCLQRAPLPPWTTAQKPVHLAGAGRQIMCSCSRTIRLSKAWNQFFPTNSLWDGRTVSILRVRSNLSFPEAIYLFQWKQIFF